MITLRQAGFTLEDNVMDVSFQARLHPESIAALTGFRVGPVSRLTDRLLDTPLMLDFLHVWGPEGDRLIQGHATPDAPSTLSTAASGMTRHRLSEQVADPGSAVWTAAMRGDLPETERLLPRAIEQWRLKGYDTPVIGKDVAGKLAEVLCANVARTCDSATEGSLSDLRCQLRDTLLAVLELGFSDESRGFHSARNTLFDRAEGFAEQGLLFLALRDLKIADAIIHGSSWDPLGVRVVRIALPKTLDRAEAELEAISARIPQKYEVRSYADHDPQSPKAVRRSIDDLRSVLVEVEKCAGLGADPEALKKRLGELRERASSVEQSFFKAVDVETLRDTLRA
jgi:hypothetical protein